MFEIMPMDSRPISGFKTRENLFVDRYRDTHYTLTDIAQKYSVSREKIAKLLPPPDLVAPSGNRTRLWLKTAITEKLGEPRG